MNKSENEYSQFSIRLKEDDKIKLQIIAEENSRTLNRQIEYLIKQAIKEYERVNREIIINKNNETPKEKKEQLVI